MFLSNSADSVYHSLQTTLRKRFGGGFLMNMAYTYGKVIDNQSGDPVGTSYTPTTSTAIDNTNLRLDRGRADFDQKHVFSTTWIYELPFHPGNGWMKTLLGGWSVQGFNSLMSGEPFSVTSGAKTANFSSVSRAALTGTTTPNDTLHSAPGVTGPVFFTNASGFAQHVPGTHFLGHGRSFLQELPAARKAFNALNHANFRKLGSTSTGSTSILSPNFGTACCQTQSTSTSTAIVSNDEAYRVVQFVLKASF